MSHRFEGKIAVVSGAAGGIGCATVRRLVSEGARVVAVDIDASALQAALADLSKDATNDILQVQADVTVEGDVERYFTQAAAHFGGVDCVFNNAGILGVSASIEDYPSAVFERVLAVNVTSVFHAMKFAIPLLRARGGGSIVNTASTAGLMGSPMLPAYSASKHAVIGLTRSGAALHAAEGIRINAVCPAPIDTAMIETLEEHVNADDRAAAKATLLKRIPAGRYGTAEEVAAVVAFLLSDESSFTNGSAYAVDGAMTPF
ncbi:MAG: NAD(P)-dependent dehydrogenase (short-subunit alcohol dehydrogenase family) [Gammaproteobacteria bacterium]|jgi:NAD(P)-dependent dehydrogenase (short-subunit alcohol dehydrogenase family)